MECVYNFHYHFQVGDEGRPLAAPPAAARNPATEALHQRSAAISNRLAQLTASQPAEPRNERVADVQSPAQLINQVLFQFFSKVLYNILYSDSTYHLIAKRPLK